MKDHEDKDKRKMSELDKKNIYKVPEGYFDELPNKIQSRIQAEKKSSRQIWMNTSVRYAAAAAIVLLIAWWGIFNPSTPEITDPDQLLSEIPTAQLVAYIESTDMTADEILDEVYLDEQSFDEIFETEQEFLEDIYTEEELLIEIDEFI